MENTKLPDASEIERLIGEHCQTVVAAALSQKGGVILEELVKGILNKRANQYDRWSFLQKALHKALERMIQEMLHQWVVQNQDMLRAMVARKMNQELTTELVAERLVDQLKAKKLYVRPFVSPEDEDDLNEEGGQD